MNKLALALALAAAGCSGPTVNPQPDGGAAGDMARAATNDADPPAADLCQPQRHNTGYTDYSGPVAAPESWTDCVALHTYDLAQATAACETHRAQNSIAAPCVATTCATGGDAVALNYGASASCGVWMYTGTGAGLLGDDLAGCRCVGIGPFWN